MSPSPTRNGGPGHHPEAPAANHKITVAAITKHEDHGHSDTAVQRSATVHITVRHVSGRVTGLGGASVRILRRTVPRSGREFDPATGEYIVYRSHVARLTAAFEKAGIDVQVTGISGGGG